MLSSEYTDEQQRVKVAHAAERSEAKLPRACRPREIIALAELSEVIDAIESDLRERQPARARRAGRSGGARHLCSSTVDARAERESVT